MSKVCIEDTLFEDALDSVYEADNEADDDDDDDDVFFDAEEDITQLSHACVSDGAFIPDSPGRNILKESSLTTVNKVGICHLSVYIWLQIARYLSIPDWLNVTSTCKSLHTIKKDNFIWTYYSKCLFANKLMRLYHNVCHIQCIQHVRNIFSPDDRRAYIICPHLSHEYGLCHDCSVCLSLCKQIRFHVSQIISTALRGMSNYDKVKSIYTYLKMRMILEIHGTNRWRAHKMGIGNHMAGCKCPKCLVKFYKKTFPFCLFKPEMCDMLDMSKNQYIKTVYGYLDCIDGFEYDRFLPYLKNLQQGWHSHIYNRGFCYETIENAFLTNFTHHDKQAFSCDEDDSSD